MSEKTDPKGSTECEPVQQPVQEPVKATPARVSLLERLKGFSELYPNLRTFGGQDALADLVVILKEHAQQFQQEPKGASACTSNAPSHSQDPSGSFSFPTALKFLKAGRSVYRKAWTEHPPQHRPWIQLDASKKILLLCSPSIEKPDAWRMWHNDVLAEDWTLKGQ